MNIFRGSGDFPLGLWKAESCPSQRFVECGEGAVVMANVGAQCMVAAGAVVSSPVPDGIMVAGNPARFVRKVAE